MFSLLALASALLYGAADFIGGLASKRANTVVIVAVSQAAGLLFVLVSVPLLAAATPAPLDWGWGVVAGLSGGIGVALLYRALAIGRMAVVAPITAVCAVAVPVLVALGLGERPGVQAGAGMALALLAIVLVSRSPHAEQGSTPLATSGSAIRLALASGVGIGVFFLALARTSAAAGVWPLVTSRFVAMTLFALLALRARQSLRLARSLLTLAVAGGVVDMSANLLYLIAARRGPLMLVVTLSSLYPASTVLLARVVLGERVSGVQWLGVVCALVAIAAIVSA